MTECSAISCRSFFREAPRPIRFTPESAGAGDRRPEGRAAIAGLHRLEKELSLYGRATPVHIDHRAIHFFWLDAPRHRGAWRSKTGVRDGGSAAGRNIT
jgi:hypothetical protein